MLVKRTATIFVALLFSSLLPTENQEKAQKKVLEAHAKAIIAEAKTLEKSGQLVEARVKYAESQAMLETRDAVDAIKHLDDEIHKRAKDVLNESRKLYEAHKYKEAAVALEQGAKMGTSQGVLSFNLALSYFQLGYQRHARPERKSAASGYLTARKYDRAVGSRREVRAGSRQGPADLSIDI